MDETLYDLIVLRYGELFLKGDNRPRFESQLEHNVRRTLADLPSIRLERGQGRLFISCEPTTARAVLERCRRVFGVSSLSLAINVAPQIEALSAAAVSLARRSVAERRPKTFRVSARRSDKRFPLPSPEIGRVVGASVFLATGVTVDLTSPELVVGVEVGPRRSFVYVDRLDGAGGLPVGASGRVALLLSGGIDSPVAGHLMQKRGCVLRAIYFHAPPFVGARTKAKVAELAGKLALAQGALELDVVRFTDVQTMIRDHGPLELSVILYRRAMMRIASAIATRHDCVALATGENLGQVASQTLSNLACIEEAARLPVLRPLLTFDKVETIALARRIGTYELSIEPYEDCCSLFVPRHPATHAKPQIVERVEAQLGLQPLLDCAVVEAETITVGGDGPELRES